MVTILLTDAQLVLAVLTGATAFVSGIIAALTAFRGLQQSERNARAIQDLHDCFDDHRAAMELPPHTRNPGNG